MATIRDVAQRAGVSVGTVSRYLNGYQLRNGNAARVAHAIKELSFKPNVAAQGLKSNRSRSIGVIVNTLTDLFASSIASELENYLEHRGYSMIVCDYRDDVNKLEQKAAFLSSRKVDGIVVFHVEHSVPSLKAFSESGKPIIAVDAPIADCKTDVVIVDNREGAATAVRRLIQAGHRNIAAIAGEPSRYTSHERLQGYLDVMNDAGLYREELVAFGDDTLESGRALMTDMLKAHPEVTAVFTSNFYMTLGAMRAARDAGRRIPGDLSIVGFDHFGLSDILDIDITAVRQPIESMGRTIGRLLVDRPTGGLDGHSTVELPTEFVEGDSVAPPRDCGQQAGQLAGPSASSRPCISAETI